MAAIITDHFRRNQAKLLVNDIKASADSKFDSPADNSNEANWPYRGNNRYAVGLGKSDSWPDNAGSVNEDATNFVVPAPTGIRQEDEDVINNLFTLKDVAGGSVKQMIAKNPWTSGRKYKVYDSADPDAFYATGDLYPCYVTHGNSVWIVLSNTAIENAFTSVVASTTPPAVSSGGDYGYSSPAQGYVWCEVAKLASTGDALITNQFVPIKRNSEVSPAINATQRKLTAGLLSHVGVVSGGTGYSANTTISATIVKHSGATMSPTIKFTPIIVGGVIQRIDIRDLQNSPSDTGSYEYWTAGDAAGLVTNSVAIDDRIKSINFVITDPGSSSESSESGGTGAQLSATIAPSTGYGYNAIDILPTWFVGINVDFEGLETDSDALALKFRQVSLLKNFVRTTQSGDTSLGSLDALKSITLHTPASSFPTLTAGQILYQQTSGAKFYYDHHKVVSGTTTLFYHQNSDGEINQIDPVANNSYGIGTALNGNQVSAGVASPGVIAPEYQSRVASGDDTGEFNGEVIFHENRKAFTRSSTQTEEVKLIIQL